MVNKRGYQRTERLNELLREIIAEELTGQDDDDLAFVTITGVDVDRELDRAKVFYTSVDGDDDTPARRDALDRFRIKAKRAIGAQARLRKTPELVFLPDDVARSAERIDSILKQLHDAE